MGRRSEISEVVGLLKSSRLVTLTGAPGVGKTRLAVELAAERASRYPDGVWLVELASVADGDGVLQATASALSVRGEPRRSLRETLRERLCDRHLLVVLDNCEHVLEECGTFAHELLRACPTIEVVATSREPLGIDGEQVWPVPSLEVPDPVTSQHVEVLAGTDSVQLFVDRATAVDPRFGLTPEIAPTVAEICRRLDGIPLAIELAAARVPMLTPGQILERLDDRLRFLTGGSRTALPRHQTLRAALEWSIDLLSEPERTLLRRLSVFVGGWTLAAAEEVCADEDLEASQVVDVLGRLANKSLVVVDTGGAEARYRLLETVRHYAKEDLAETGEDTALRGRHVAWCAQLAEQAERELTGPHQGTWYQRLDLEHDNLRTAIESAVAAGEAAPALRLVGSLAIFWRVRGHLGEGVERTKAALSVSEQVPGQLRAKALWAAGLLKTMVGDLPAARSHGEQSLALFSEAGDVAGKARALNMLGVVLLFSADTAGALGLLEESTALARQAEDDWCLVEGLAAIGRVRILQDDVASARCCFQECAEVALSAEDHQGIRSALSGLGWTKLLEGDWIGAEWLLGEALRLAQELGEPHGAAVVLSFLGELHWGRGDYARARALLEEGLALGRAHGSPVAIARNLCFLAKTLYDEGNPAAACPLFEEALTVALGAGETYTAARCREGLGESLYALGDKAKAMAVLEEAVDFARNHGDGRGAACALHFMGWIIRLEGDPDRAAPLHHEALALQSLARDLPGIAKSLDALAGLAAIHDSPVVAARMFGAAESLREANGYARSPATTSRIEEDLALVRANLPADQLDAAFSEGAAMSLADAVSYAAKGRGSRTRQTTGWGSLTKSERQVAGLVVEGLTNREIAQRLFVSHRTVNTHLQNMFAKLGINSRVELAVEALRDGAPGL